jgi:hypothetical protein
MAGTPRGRVDAYTSLAYTNGAPAQYAFAFIYQFFLDMQTAGYCTILATNYGFVEGPHSSWGGTSGTGMDYYGGSNPAGENAWFLVRYNVSTARPGGAGNLGAYYCLFQWSADDTFGANNSGAPNGSDGYPGRVSYFGTNFDGVTCTVAFRTDGGNPFNGGALLTGSDTAASVDTSVNNTLRVRVVGAGSYEVIPVTAGASTAKTTIRDDLNTYFTTNNIRLEAQVRSNKLRVHGTECNGVDIDTIAGGSTLNTPVGFTDGATINSNIGADAKGTPVWADGGTGTLRVMDVANGPGGSYVTDKQSMMRVCEVYIASAITRRFHMIGDEDNFWFVFDEYNYGNYWNADWFAVSLFEPLSSHPNGYPLVIMSDEQGLPPVKGAGYGALDGSSRYENGAIVAPDAFGNVVGRVIPHGYPGNLDGSSVYAPQRHLSDDTQKTYLECPNWLEFYEGGGTGTDFYAPIGSKAFMSEIYNLPPASMSSDGLRLFMNNNTTNVAQRTAFIWNGAFPPGMRTSTAGLGYQVP